MSDQDNRNFVLRTKLYRPAVSATLIRRLRLHEKLDAGLNMPLSLVAAPAGCGKSILLCHWAETLDRKVAWLSLDDEDNDLSVFIRYFLAAIDNIFPGSCPLTRHVLDQPDLPSVNSIGGVLLNEFDIITEPFMLVLDDYHRIRNTKIHELLRFLVFHCPPNMHLVIATRRDPPLPLHSLSGVGKLNQVRLDDLTFTLEETREFFAQSSSIQMSENALANATRSVDGWAIGLSLISLALHNQKDPERFLASLTGGFGPVQEFLLNEVLLAQTSSIISWLHKTSILGRFCAPLCEAVCRGDESDSNDGLTGQEFIDTLNRNNLFCLALDYEGTWFRFHHQFQSLLKQRLKSGSSKEEVASLYSLASDWFAESGLIDEAINYSVKLGDKSKASRLVLENSGKLILQEEGTHLENWLRQLGEETVQQDARLSVLSAWTHYFRMRIPEWKMALDRAITRINEMKLPVEEYEWQMGFVDSLRSSYCYFSGELDEAIECATRASLQVPSEYLRLRVHALVVKVLALHASGKKEEAYRQLKDMAADPDYRIPQIQVLILTLYVAVNWLDSNILMSRHHALRLLRVARESAVPQHVDWARNFTALGAYWANDLDEVESQLGFQTRDPRTLHVVTFQDESALLVFIHLARGRLAEAEAAANRVSDFGLEVGNPELCEFGNSLRAEIHARSANREPASHWAANFAGRKLQPQFGCYFPELTLAKILIDQDTEPSRERAFTAIVELEEFARSTHFSSVLIMALGMRAILSDQTGQHELATGWVEEALALAATGGGVRLFLDLGPPIAQLLGKVKMSGEAELFRCQLLNDFKNERKHAIGFVDSAGGIASDPDPSAILTPREHQVLNLLVLHSRDKQIAGELFISTETVKSHLKNLFQKLDVHTRVEAVDKARSMKILSEN